MDEKTKLNLVRDAEGLKEFFSVDIVIKIFGHVIWEMHFPPKSN